MPTGTLLIIDDEARLRQLLAQVPELEGYTVLQAPDATRGLELLRQHADDVLLVLSDVKLPDANGVDLLPRLKAVAPEAEVVLLTAYGTIPDGVKAMKLGAFDYLTKGDFEQQLVVVDRAAEKARLRKRVTELERRVGQQYRFESMIGDSAELKRVQKLAQQIAPTDTAPCCSKASPAAARSFLPRPSTRPVGGGARPSWPSIAAPSPRICSNRSCLATRKGTSPRP